MARADAGLTISELSRRAGVARDTISKAEKGEHAPNAATLNKIARALGVTPSALLAREEQLSPKAGRRSSLEPSLFNGVLEGEWRTEDLEIPVRVRQWAPTIAVAWSEAPGLLKDNVGHAHLNRAVEELVSAARAMPVPEILALIQDLDVEDRWLRQHVFKTHRHQRKTREGRRAYRDRLRQLTHVLITRLLALADVAEEKAIDLPPDERQEAVESIQRGVDRILEGVDARV